MAYCSHCQLVHGEEHRFCQRCGQILKGSAAGARACARCGSLTFSGQKFCTECGLPLRAVRGADEEEAPPVFYPRNADLRSRRRASGRRPWRAIFSLLGLILVVGVVYYAWRLIPASKTPVVRTPVTAAPQDDMRREVERVAEKIRAAHLNKDINKWLSCYNSAYPNLGKLESRILELWKNYDIKDVNYRIANVQRQGDQASADIGWNIQLYEHRSNDYTLLRDSYKIILEKSGNEWKIKDSRVEGGGSS